MFLFKCCSNHSLPNFLKSSKGQPSPITNQASISTGFQGRCSDEVVNGRSFQSAEVLDGSVSVDFGNVEVKKEAASVEDLIFRQRKSSDGCGRKIVIKSLRKSPVEIRSSSSNSIVLLVGDNRVKTKLLKHIQSLPCDSSNLSENKNKNIEQKVLFKQRDGNTLPDRTGSRKLTASKSCFSDESHDSFMFESVEAVCIDHAELVLKRIPIKRRIKVDELQITTLISEQQENDRYFDLPICSDSRGYNDVPQDLPLLYFAKESTLEETLDDLENPEERSYSGKIREQSSIIFNDVDSDKEKFHSVPQNGDDPIQLDIAESIQELCDRDGCETSLSQTEQREDFNRKCLPEITEEHAKSEIDKQNDPEAHPSKQPGTNVMGVSTKEDEVEAAVVGIQVVSGSENPKDQEGQRLCNNSSIDMIFAGETASFLEEFLPREGYTKPTEFTFIGDLLSPTTSEDSIKNVDELTTSNDSLLSDKSFVQTALRPCSFTNSQVMFSNSPESDTSDESVQNNSGNNSVTDSLLESPESPGGGLDFRHFYSKSLPNLDRQPYDSMSSLSIIEEYFNRYIIECGSSDSDNDNRQGSQVDPKFDGSSEKSDNSKVCLEDQNRHHSLEKLTEICKKFSSTYLNFLHSSRIDHEADSAVDQSPENPSESPATDAKGQENDNSAAALSHGALALYAAIFPHPDSKEFSHAKTPAKDNDRVEVISSIKPSLAGRSVSLRESPLPGVKKVPKKKKAVKFADSFGLELAIVRLILSGENLSDQDFQQRFQSSQGSSANNSNSNSNNSINNVDKSSDDGRSKSTKPVETRKIVAAFVQPETSDEFMQRVEVLRCYCAHKKIIFIAKPFHLKAQKIILESCLPEENSRSVSGCIRVKNLSYEKTIVVRYTLNDWLSYNEAYASYVYGSNDGHTDRFSFSVKLPSFFDVGSSIEFAIMYRMRDGTEYWDNNGGCNYRMTCQRCWGSFVVLSSLLRKNVWRKSKASDAIPLGLSKELRARIHVSTLFRIVKFRAAKIIICTSFLFWNLW